MKDDYLSLDVGLALDYLPFGQIMPNRHGEENSYKYGFNGKEKLDELHDNSADSYDFGARMYDARIGRFLSLDPLKQQYSGNSAYSYAQNSPIFLIDFGGKHPKIAIFLENVPENKVHPAFLIHRAALKLQGYKFIYARSAESALVQMSAMSIEKGPIENLIIISHASPGGPNSGPNGFYTDSELRDFAKKEWTGNRFDELLKNTPANDNTDLIQKSKDDAEVFWNGVTQESLCNQEALIEAYKVKTNSVSMNDLETAVNDGKLNFSENATIVIAGCNAGGYHPSKGDKQEIFSTTLAKILKHTVFSSEGYTGPGTVEPGQKSTTKRVSNKSVNRRDLLGHWIKTTSDGARTKGGNTIDMAKPKIK